MIQEGYLAHGYRTDKESLLNLNAIFFPCIMAPSNKDFTVFERLDVTKKEQGHMREDPQNMNQLSKFV